MSKIFTSIIGPTFEACKKQIVNIRNAELRLDMLELSAANVQELWPSCQRWMVTIRKGFFENTGWKEIFEACIFLKPDYIDIDSELPESDFQTLLKIIGNSDSRLILSYHNYDLTPSFEELKQVTLSLINRGAKVVQLACMVNDYNDNVILLRLYGEFDNIITIGMGEKGKVSRLNALYFGEQVSYAAASQEEAAAPGQMTYQEMRNLEKALKCD